jgi:hypothetical protein
MNLAEILWSQNFLPWPIALHGGGMIKELEKQIGDLTEELAGVQKDQTLLRLQPCRGDSDIREKDAKFEELDRRGTIIRKIIVDLTRKHQLLISESASRGRYE